jgi:hypothetical protein
MYPSTSLFIAIGQFAIVLNVLLAYPLQVHPCRNCLDKVFHAGAHTPIKQRTPGVLPGTGSDGNGVANENEEEVEDELHPSHEMSDFKHGALTSGIIMAGFVIAYFVDDLQHGKPRLSAYVHGFNNYSLFTFQSLPLLDPLDRQRFHSSCQGCSTGRCDFLLAMNWFLG